MSRVLLIGVGNRYRRDDAAGLEVVRRLSGRVPPTVTLLEEEAEPTQLLDRWAGAAAIVVIDAVSSGAPPGTIHRFDAASDPLPSRYFAASTHAMSVADAIELARALRTLPPHAVVYGIESRMFDAGVGLSPEVEAAVQALLPKVAAEAAALAEEGAGCTNTR